MHNQNQYWPLPAGPFARGGQETKGQAAERLYLGLTFDYALPQQWVDEMRLMGFEPVPCVVWGYGPGDGLTGRPWPLTRHAAEWLQSPAEVIFP